MHSCIVLIDLLLGADNAVVIAMAVRAPARQRRIGILAARGLAVLSRVTDLQRFNCSL